MHERTRVKVLDAALDVLDWNEVLPRLASWGAGAQSRYVVICNVHSVVTAGQDSAFARIIDAADLVTADGAPVAWMMRRLGHRGQQRINGPDLMWRYCEQASLSGEAIYLYGGSADTLAKLQQRLLEAFPGLSIAGAHSPPFRTLTAQEDADDVARINGSGAATVWVGLGCPKQEAWMAAHRGRVKGVMIGVGAAFDYHAGTIKRAPLWMQQAGLEWLHRLVSEPRRLGRRYLVTNTRFINGAFKQLMRNRHNGK
jgi:N-acetylglucosaminyldiphosphoundecaprenol N-acetyl-beta-D-mannosaminyltransferase